MTILLLVSLLDGSTVNLQIPQQTVFEFQTRYGVLKIPVSDISECRLGVHIDEPPLFEQSIKDLGADQFESRTRAMKFLKANQRGAFPYLLALKESPNLESKRRAELLLKDYSEVPDVYDVLNLKGDRITGLIVQKELVGRSASIGEMKLRLSVVRALLTSSQKQNIRIEIGQDWQKVGYCAGRLNLTTTGEVDLWTNQPGQYMTKACGHSTQHQGYPAGALMGRIGTRQFLVGESFLQSGMPSGQLELKINGSPWAFGGTSGHYDVVIE